VTTALELLPSAGTARAAQPSAAAPFTVCQLLHTLDVGGAEVLAGRLARRLAGRFRFVFACLDAIGSLGERLRADGFAVHLVGRRPGLDWRCPLRLAAVLRGEHVDVVHAHQYTPFFYAMAARLRGPRRPIVFTEHGRHQPDRRRPRRVWANRLLVSGRDRLFAVGDAVRRALIDHEGLPAGRVGVIFNGIDLAAFGSADRAAARAAMGAAGDELVILQVARLDYLKDHATAVRALARFTVGQPHARLVLVGDGPERPAIEALARELGVAGRVRLLGARSDVPRLLSGADVLLLSSVSEGIPLTPIEAMAAGLPVVATDVGGVGEVVVDGETGLLAPARDDAALAVHLARLAGDAGLRRRFGEAGRARARRLFDEARMCDDYGRVYRELARA
jgi:glycosyltransferase involved in cell wall biosynthesis